MITIYDIECAVKKLKSKYMIKKAGLYSLDASFKEYSEISLIVEFEEEAISLFDLAGLKFDL